MTEALTLRVLLHGAPVGTLTLLPGDQSLFAFSQAYIDAPDRPVLSLSFKGAAGGLITDIRPRRTRLPPFLSNLLPEGHLRDYLARRAGVNPAREFFLLRALGGDLPGAVSIEPAGGSLLPEADEALAEEEAIRAGALRFSLAGVQLKFSAVASATGGLTIPAEGVGGSWIVKLPSLVFKGVPENEYAMMELARAIGIEVPELRLVPLAEIGGLPEELGRLGGKALAVKRFDRAEDGSPIHIEDFAQVFGVDPERKYERASYASIARVLWAEAGEDGLAEFVRRLVFNVLIGNGNMHLKNWSLIYPDGRKAALSPGYDFVSTISYLPDEKLALKLGGSKRMADLSEEGLTYLAGKARIPERLVLPVARETVEAFRAAWDGGAPAPHLESRIVDGINGHLTRVALLTDRLGLEGP